MYLRFMEDLGVECVCTRIRWAYFRKKSADGPFDLFSDIDSRINFYKRLTKMFGLLIFINLLVCLSALLITLLTGRITYFNIINFIIMILFTPMFISYIRKIIKMKREKQLHE